MSKRLINRLCITHVGLLAWQVLLAQIAGIFMILSTSLILSGTFLKHAWSCIFVASATLLYYLASYILFSKELDSATLLDRLRKYLGALVLFDLAVVLGLIGLSGGLSKSHLTFILVLMPTILALIRGGGRTIFSICFIIFAAVLFEFLANLFKTPALSPIPWISVPFSYFGFLPSDNPQDLPRYPYAISVGIFFGIVLAWIQSRYASGETLPDDALWRVIDQHPNGLDDVLAESRLRKVLAQSYHKASRIVSLTNHPDIHCSLVHPIDDLIFEAYILTLPAYRFSGTKVASLMANMVFAIHWLDDLVDGLGYHDIFEKNQLNLQWI